MRKTILRRDYNPQAIFNDLHPVLGRVYAARKVQTMDELDCTLDKLLPYHALSGLDQAVVILADAIMQQQKILIVGDFDADGATSTAVAVRALKSFGAKHVHYLVPNRFAYGYGLTPELVTAAKEHDPALIITVDNGIANHAGVDAAKAVGIRVVITDHHLPAQTLPAADAIVNPNQHGDSFPSKNLAGVGVIFYVMLALRRFLIEQQWFIKNAIAEPNMSKLLDIVALGTVADLVALDQNNRVLVYQGLRRINAGQCIPGIVALLEIAGRDFTRATVADLGFAVAARLNAAGRLDDMSLGIECLLSDDSIHARQIAKQLDKLNLERRSIERDMQAQALAIVEKLSANLTEQFPYGLCLFDPSWHQGVIGILASRVKDKFNRPVIIFAPGQGDELKGSCRSISGLHIRDVLALIDVQYPELILKFGGHAMAAGLTIKQENFSRFNAIFNDMVKSQITEAQLQHTVLSDGELSAHDFSLELATLLRNGGPWGQAFPEPLFDGAFRVLDQRIVGDKHLKLRLEKEDKMLDAVAFFVNMDDWPNHRCEEVHAAYRLDINEYKGRSNVQLIIEYLEQK